MNICHRCHPVLKGGPIFPKDRLIQSFSRAAPHYDTYAHVQLEVAGLLMARIRDRPYQEILELGCGTGFFTRMLAQTFEHANILAIDISPLMITTAKAKFVWNSRVRLQRMDGEHLPVSISGPFDLITASGTLQWFDDLGNALQHYRRILWSSGSLVFALFGPDTLFELNQTLEHVLNRKVSLPADTFANKSKLEDLLSRAFEKWQVEEVSLSRTYPDLLSLLRSLKGTGVAPRTKTGPLVRTRSGLLEIERYYKKCFGEIRSTYQVFFCEATKL